MSTVAVRDDTAAVMERVVVQGDLSKLSPEDRVVYYREVCRSLNLNPLTQPFQYVTLSGKLTLYARRDATDQLRSLRNVSVEIVARERHEEVYVVTARATMPDGRTDESIGAVPIAGLKGELLANALMKCETKAKRRVTLSVCGLGLLDETETETIAGAIHHPAQTITKAFATGHTVTDDGEIVDEPTLTVHEQLKQDITRIVHDANECVSPGHLRLLGEEADRKGLLGDAEVLGALQAAKSRLKADKVGVEQPAMSLE